MKASTIKGVSTGVGTVATALLANACCWLPPLLIMVGAGAGLAHVLEPWKPLLLTLMVAQLAWGFYSVYKPKCDHHGCHHAPGTELMHRRTRIGAMWGVAFLVIGLNVYGELSHRNSHADHVHITTNGTTSLASNSLKHKCPDCIK